MAELRVRARACVFVLYVRALEPESLEARCISSAEMIGSGEGRREEATLWRGADRKHL